MAGRRELCYLLYAENKMTEKKKKGKSFFTKSMKSHAFGIEDELNSISEAVIRLAITLF